MKPRLSSLFRRLIRSAPRLAAALPQASGMASAGLPLVVALGLASPAAAQNGPTPALARIDRDCLCVTNGTVSESGGGQLAIETATSRAVVQSGSEHAADQVAEIHFRYLGPSDKSQPLASGRLRRQVGLKLRAEDSCNLIYVMWRIEPEARVAVSIKRNVGQHTHQQCGVRGYTNFKPQAGSRPLPVLPGEAHTLRAELRGEDLTVMADGKVAWRGSLASATSLPVGPPGLRTDNARVAFEYFTAAAPRPAAQQMPPPQGQCLSSEGD
jgi:hypothetical protein